MHDVQRPGKYGSPILYICIFLSGAAGLSYEVLWSKILGLSYGHSIYAVTTVLSAFMGGLALGSHVFGQIADRFHRPLLLYGVLEIIIGAYSLSIPLLLTFIRKIYLSLYPFLVEQSAVRIALQFLLAFGVLIVPTTLMGGTLPILCRALVSRADESGPTVAFIYGVNTVGAALGAFGVGYWLIPKIGILATNYIGVSTNVLAGGIVIFMFGKKQFSREEFEANGPIPDEHNTFGHMVLIALALSGGVGMLYQIAWIRSLILVIGSSTYAFSSILVIFLLGLGLGSLIFKRLKFGSTFWFFPALQICIGLATFLLIPFFDFLPRIFLVFIRSYKGSFPYVLSLQFFIVAAIVLVPTILMGMVYPCAVGLLSRKIDRVGRDVGRYYAFNTVGAIAGSFLTGFLLIPYLGARSTLILGVILNVVIACSMLIVLYPERMKVFIPLSAACVLLTVLFPPWDIRILNSAVSIYPYRYFKEESRELKDILAEAPEILYFQEGVSSTVSVVESLVDGQRIKSLLINGKIDASDGTGDLETQVKLSGIPMLLSPRPERVAIIGLGSGVTAGVAALFHESGIVHVIELEPSVVQASTHFNDVNYKPLDRGRVKMHIDDGRSFIEGTGELFDVIISEPPNPWMAGVAELFTVEFFEQSRRKLSSGGIFCQWVQGYMISPEELKMIFRSFLTAFPDSTLWLGGGFDFLLIGRQSGAEAINLENIRTRFHDNEPLENVLRKYGIFPIEGLLSSFLLDPRDLKTYSGEGPLNRDDRPLLEFLAPKSIYKNFISEIRREILSHKKTGHPYFIAAPELDTPEFYIKLGGYLMKMGRMDEASVQFSKAPSYAPFVPSSWKESWIRGGPVVKRGYSFEDSFVHIPFFPWVGSYRPQESDRENFKSWSTYLNYFTRSSGVFPGMGRGLSRGLVIKSVEGVATVGYYVPLAVKPATRYTVDFWMKCDLERGGEGGVGIFEYDSLRPEERQFDRSFIDKHLVSATKKISVHKMHDWKGYSFSFRTSSETRMLHLLFYGEGSFPDQKLSFDDVSIREGG